MASVLYEQQYPKAFQFHASINSRSKLPWYPCLDADAEMIMLLHNPTIVGGSWLQSEKKLVALTGFDHKPVALHLTVHLIVDMKQKVPLWKDIQATLENGSPLQESQGKEGIISL